MVPYRGEEEELEKLLKDFYMAENRKDIEAVMEYYDENIVYLGPNEPPVKGKQSLKHMYEELFMEDFRSSGEFDYILVAESRDFAYGVGHERMGFKSETGETWEDGKFLSVYRKTDNNWKCVALSSNRNNSK